MNPGTSDNSRLGIAAVIGGLVLLVAIALGLIANAVNNSGNPTPGSPTPTHGPCATCLATRTPVAHPTATKVVYPTQVPTVPAPLPSEQPTLPAPLPTTVPPTAIPTAPEPVPTK